MRKDGKLRNFIDGEGWTVVRNGPLPRKRSRRCLEQTSIDPRCSPGDIGKQLRIHSSLWLDSQCCKEFGSTLATLLQSAENVSVDKCVCLGLGSFTDGRESSKHQLATLLWMLDRLKGTYNLRQIIFQDPVFTSSDVTYLESLGYIVLRTPHAFDAITSSTFLFAPHLESNIYATALSREVPAMCVGSNVDALLNRLDDHRSEAEEREWENATFKSFQEVTSSWALSVYEHDPWWYHTCLYWRKPHVTRNACIPA